MPNRPPFTPYFFLLTTYFCFGLSQAKHFCPQAWGFFLFLCFISERRLDPPQALVSKHSTFWVMGQVSVIWSDGSQPKRQLLISNRWGIWWDLVGLCCWWCVSFNWVVSTTCLCWLTLQSWSTITFSGSKCFWMSYYRSGFTQSRLGSIVIDIWYWNNFVR